MAIGPSVTMEVLMESSMSASWLSVQGFISEGGGGGERLGSPPTPEKNN